MWFPPLALGHAVLQRASEEVAECLRRAAELDARAEAIGRPENKADYRLLADSWRKLAQRYQFQESLGRFVSFNDSRANALDSIFPAHRETGSSARTAAAPQEAELALRNNAETVLRNTPFLLTRCSSDLRYVFVSEACARMLGYQPEDLAGEKNR